MAIRFGGAEEIDLAQLAALFHDAGWPERAGDVSGMVAGSRFVVTAWDTSALVGFGRAYSDGVTGAYLTDVMVRSSHRRQGIGRSIVQRLLDETAGLKVTLRAPPHMHAFYGSLGFSPAEHVFVRKRRVDRG